MTSDYTHDPLNPYPDGWSQEGMAADFIETTYDWDGDGKAIPKDGEPTLADFPTAEETIVALYVSEDYQDTALVLFVRDGKLMEAGGSHCSCYGLEGQWGPEEGELAAILNYKWDDEYSWPTVPVSTYGGPTRQDIKQTILARSRLLLGDERVELAITLAALMRAEADEQAVRRQAELEQKRRDEILDTPISKLFDNGNYPFRTR